MKKRRNQIAALTKKAGAFALALTLGVSALPFSSMNVLAADETTESTGNSAVEAGIISYNIDFGPRKDSTSTDPQIATSGQSAAAFAEKAVAGAQLPDFQLGAPDMLYATNVDATTGLHWGFVEEPLAGNTANGGAYFRDWVYAKDSGATPYTFKADLPTGEYYVFVYNGIKEGDENCTKLIFDNEVTETTNTAATETKDGKTVYVQDNTTGSQYPAAESVYYVKVTKNDDALSSMDGIDMGTLSITVFDDTAASERTGCLNGLEIFPMSLDVEPETADTTELEALIKEVSALSQYSYTADSWKKLAEALTAAKAQVGNLDATEATVAAAKTALEKAVDELESNGHDFMNPFDDTSDTAGFVAWGKSMDSTSGTGYFSLSITEDEDNYLNASVSNAGGDRGSRLDISTEIVKGATVSFDWMPVSASNGSGQILFLAPDKWHSYFTLRFDGSGNILYYTVNPLGSSATTQNAFDGAIGEGAAIDTGLGSLNTWYTVEVSFDYLEHTANLTVTEKANTANTYTVEDIPIETEANGLKSVVIHADKSGGKITTQMGMDDLTVDFVKFGDTDIVSIVNPDDVKVARADYSTYEFPTEVTANLADGTSIEVAVGEWTSSPAFDAETEAVYTWTAPLVTENANLFKLKATFDMDYTLYPFPLRAYNPTTLELEFGEEWDGVLPKTVCANMSDGTFADVEVGEWTAIREFNAEEEGIYVYGANLVATDGVNKIVPEQLAQNEYHVNGSDKASYTYDVYYRISYFETDDNYNGYARTMEWLDRGLYAVATDEGVFLSWRLLATEYESGVEFVIFRNDTQITEEYVSATNYLDTKGKAGDVYSVGLVTETGYALEEGVTALSENYLSIPLQKPEAQPSKTGELATYSINDAGTADVDGDGEYELIVKWYPSNGFDSGNAKKPSSPTIFDVYKMDGTPLWRLNMGLEMPSGAHFNQFMLYDMDEDGKAELFIKTSDGTTTYRPNDEGLFDMEDESTIVSYIGDKDVVPGTNINSNGHAAATTNEYVTVFNGLTGEEIDTIDFINTTGEYADWGKSDGGNRSARYNIAIAYLPKEEGSTETIPAVLFNRGYYAKTTVAAYTLRDNKLQLEWNFVAETGAAYSGKGNHNVATGDIDNDGFDELVLGAIALDHDGSVLWVKDGENGYDYAGHADSIHLAAMNPENNQLYVVTPAEDSGSTQNVSMTNAATGARIAGEFITAMDMGRGMAANITPLPGYEFWAQRPNSEIVDQVPSGSIYRFTGEVIAEEKPLNFPANWCVYWDGDLLSELPDSSNPGVAGGEETIFKYNWENNSLEVLETFEGTKTNNGTKNNPSLSADLFGDWREEMVVAAADDSELRIYMTTISTDYMIYTLMHDPVYRNAVANQNTSYNQPPHVGFYLGEDNKEEVLAMNLPTANLVYANAEDDGSELNKLELRAQIQKFEQLTEADYTANSWSNANTAYIAAKEAYADAETQEALNTAAETLKNEIAQLVSIAALNKVIAKAESLTSTDYTADSWAAMQTALTAAKTIQAKAGATQTEADTAKDNLQAAMDKLAAALDKTNLAAAIAWAEALNELDYTSSTWETFKITLNYAKNIYAKTDATQAEIEEATTALNGSLLIERADVTLLKAKVSEAKTFLDTAKEEDYSAEGWQAFKEALKAAETIAETADATQEQADLLLTNLTNALEGLEPVPDKTTLNAAIALAEEKKEADYTAESWAALAEALEKAKTVQADDDANQSEIDDALLTLNTAISGLEEAVEIVISDLPDKHWSYNFVTDAVRKEIMSGVATNEDGSILFGLEDNLTREMLVQILYNATVTANNGVEPEVGEEIVFTDVSEGQWYTKAIIWARENGISEGYDDGTFGLGKFITRCELATMLYNYAEKFGYDTTNRADLSSFVDADEIPEWAEDTMSWAVGSEIMSGAAGGILDPTGEATRAAAATMIMQFLYPELYATE